ncbi:MAG: hypothetical protein ABW032_00275 [Burkholderiaceae bacterium]
MHNPPAAQIPAPRRPALDKGIDWEPLPSLAYLIARAKPRPDEPVWEETMPASLETPPPSAPFSEPLPGLALREVTEPDIFRLFFDR